ncbi:Cyclin N-terminal domain-containing protein [Mycena venus]|uniref:Cyclin N-terminal domain-containing protein n=1 Tax=Mycena venus TaxID=2733690 RepID=A0A8H6XFN5_9AGAR|nr:Cyclin N-terminal domain-containing protein [Mycena venus]
MTKTGFGHRHLTQRNLSRLSPRSAVYIYNNNALPTHCPPPAAHPPPQAMNSPATSDSSSSSSGSSPASTSDYSSWSPSSSKTSSPVHPASLVDPSTHSPELMQLVDIDLSRPVVEYVVSCVQETVDYAFGRSARPRGRSRSPRSHKFTNFVSNVLSRAEVTPATLLVALVYIARSRRHLSIALEQWALERVFLGALIVASKYTQDSTLRNVHWALVTGVFGKGDIGRIEREFLEVLDWELSVTEADVLAHHEGLNDAAGFSESWVAKEETVNVLHPSLALALAHPHSPTSAPVPELEPSSPHSSAGSLSPRTPISHSVSPDADADMDDVVDSPTCTLVSPTMAVDMHSAIPTPAPAPTPVSARTTTPPPRKRARHGHGHARRKLCELLSAFHYPHHHHNAVEVAA